MQVSILPDPHLRESEVHPAVNWKIGRSSKTYILKAQRSALPQFINSFALASKENKLVKKYIGLRLCLLLKYLQAIENTLHPSSVLFPGEEIRTRLEILVNLFKLIAGCHE